MPVPGSYDGKPDLDVFDSWTFSIVNYMEFMRADDESMIRLLETLVTGIAKQFYMSSVARKPHKFTVARFIRKLFDYCFPDDVIERLRRRWENLTQGKKRVRDYARELENLARKFREMNERQVVLKFWNGLHGELRGDMVLLDIDPEVDGLDRIIRYASKCEKAQDQRKRYIKEDRERQPEGGNRKPNREWTRFKTRNGGAKHYRPGNTEPERSKPDNRSENRSDNRSDRIRANSVSPQNAPKDRHRPGPSHNKLSRAKLDNLRAEGRCFNCHEQGHEQRNCPKLNSMKPPKSTIKTGSIRFAHLDKLAERKDRADVYIGSMSIIGSDPVLDRLNEFEELELRIHRLCEETWGEDPLWYNEETRPDSNYGVDVFEDEITIWNFATKENRTFERAKLDDPTFNIAEIFAFPEPDRTPTSVREGGYPNFGDYQQWHWPATNWMRARLSGQLEFVDGNNAPADIRREDRIDVQPTMTGYSIQLDESDIIYNVTHEEVLNKHFSPEWIIDHMISAKRVPAED